MIVSDIVEEINGAHREVTSTGNTHRVLVRRDYAAPIADVWDACTAPERIARWLMPVSGDLRLGGRYQLEGNAGGEILACEPPRLLRVSWVFGDTPPSEVEVRLTEGEAGATAFQLAHLMPDGDPQFWAQFGPGAVGVGWDLALIGLAHHLRGADLDGDTLGTDPVIASANGWGTAHLASGADPAAVNAAVTATTAFYTAAAPPEQP